MALIALFGVILSCDVSYSATANINFSGYVRPKASSKTIAFPQTIYSFSDKVALPIFPAPVNSRKREYVRVYMGNRKTGKRSQQVHFDTISFNAGSSVRQQAVVINMSTSKQIVYVCYGKSTNIDRGCVQFNAVKID